MTTPEVSGVVSGIEHVTFTKNGSSTALPGESSLSTALFTNLQRDNLFATESSANYVFHCKDGLILPCWNSDRQTSTMIIHGAIYLLALIYAFVGVAIIADRFMA